MEQPYFAKLARYNRWANERLYAACAELGEAGLKQPRPCFFGSIHATLNHILAVDRIWMGRIEGADSGVKALDQILHEDFPGLRQARRDFDDYIIAAIDGLNAAELSGTVRYANMAGVAQETPMAFVLAHLINHATHHRGQVHALLSQTPVAPPPMDLIYFLREEA